MNTWKSWTWGKIFIALAVVCLIASYFVTGYDYVFGFTIGVCLSVGFIFWLYPYYMRSAMRKQETILKYERELKELWDYMGIENGTPLALRGKVIPPEDRR